MSVDYQPRSITVSCHCCCDQVDYHRELAIHHLEHGELWFLISSKIAIRMHCLETQMVQRANGDIEREVHLRDLQLSYWVETSEKEEEEEVEDPRTSLSRAPNSLGQNLGATLGDEHF